jgi:hypothetical protein
MMATIAEAITAEVKRFKGLSMRFGPQKTLKDRT